jgi:hypothetical protein
MERRRVVAAWSSSALIGIRQTGGGFMKTLTLTLAAAALALGAMALSANAQAARRRPRPAPERHADREAGGMSRFRPALRSGLRLDVRPIRPLLVPALLNGFR